MEISTIGLDLTKSIFQVHAVDASGEIVVRKTLRRAQVLAFFAKLPPCLIGMNAGCPIFGASTRPAAAGPVEVVGGA